LALKLTVVSEAVVLMKTNPLWTTLLVVYMYKTEKMTLRTMVEIALCLFGVALITKPPFLLNMLGYPTQETKFTYLYFIGLCLSLMTAITTSIT
jgi:drug/metabolite transporter (DMT)-like permease